MFKQEPVQNEFVVLGADICRDGKDGMKGNASAFQAIHFLTDIAFLKSSLATRMKKISIFMLVVLSTVIIMGSVMYLVEMGENGFESISNNIYRAIVTIATMGYGDILPVTLMGKFILYIMMFIGYGIIAVPTGITTNMAMGGTQ